MNILLKKSTLFVNDRKKGNQKYSQVGNAQKQRIIYVNGKWI